MQEAPTVADTETAAPDTETDIALQADPAPETIVVSAVPENPAPAATDTDSLWAQVASGDTFDFLTDLVDDLDLAAVALAENDAAVSPAALSHALVRQHFETFEDIIASVTADDLSF